MTDDRQMSIADLAAPRTDDEGIEVRFRLFHERHPEVYYRLRTLARLAVARGARKLGIGMLWEVLRWEYTIGALPSEGEAFKLNNDYRSRYARLLMDQEKDLDGMFEVRAIRSR